jgi:TPR repeat protein
MSGVGEPKDGPKALDLFRKACEAGRLEACIHLGSMYGGATGIAGVLKDDPMQVATYHKVCDASGSLCHLLGRLYETGTGVERDIARAGELYVKSCENGSDQGCLSLLGVGADTDRSRALQALGNSCNGGRDSACLTLGDLYDSGSPKRLRVPKDPAVAVDWYQKACASGEPRGCMRMVGIYEKGDGVEKDFSKAVGALRHGCEIEPKYGNCNRLSELEKRAEEQRVAIAAAAAAEKERARAAAAAEAEAAQTRARAAVAAEKARQRRAEEQAACVKKCLGKPGTNQSTCAAVCK